MLKKMIMGAGMVLFAPFKLVFTVADIMERTRIVSSLILTITCSIMVGYFIIEGIRTGNLGGTVLNILMFSIIMTVLAAMLCFVENWIVICLVLIFRFPAYIYDYCRDEYTYLKMRY